MPINEEQFKKLDSDQRFLLTEIDKKLVGGIITGGFFDHNEGVIGMRIENKGKVYCCWIIMDPEGNGPGWIDIQEEKPGKEGNLCM